MIKYKLSAKNSAWGLQTDGLGRQFYSHIVDFPNDVDDEHKWEFLQNEMGISKDDLVDMPDQANPINNSNSASFSIDLNDYPNETLESMLNKDFCVMLDTNTNHYSFWAVDGSKTSNNTTILTYNASRDWLFERGIDNIFRDDRDVIIERGNSDNVINLDDKGNALWNIAPDSDNFYSENFEEFQDGAFQVKEELVLNTDYSDKVIVKGDPESDSWSINFNDDTDGNKFVSYHFDDKEVLSYKFYDKGDNLRFIKSNNIQNIASSFVQYNKNTIIFNFIAYTIDYQTNGGGYITSRPIYHIKNKEIWFDKKTQKITDYGWSNLADETLQLGSNFANMFSEKYGTHLDLSGGYWFDPSYSYPHIVLFVNVAYQNNGSHPSTFWNSSLFVLNKWVSSININKVIGDKKVDNGANDFIQYIQDYFIKSNEVLGLFGWGQVLGTPQWYLDWAIVKNVKDNNLDIRQGIIKIPSGEYYYDNIIGNSNTSIITEYKNKAYIWFKKSFVLQNTNSYVIGIDEDGNWIYTPSDWSTTSDVVLVSHAFNNDNICVCGSKKGINGLYYWEYILDNKTWTTATLLTNTYDVSSSNTLNYNQRNILNLDDNTKEIITTSLDGKWFSLYNGNQFINITKYINYMQCGYFEYVSGITPDKNEAVQYINNVMNNVGFSIIKFQTKPSPISDYANVLYYTYEEDNNNGTISIKGDYFGFKNAYPKLTFTYSNETIQNNLNVMLIPHFKMNTGNLEVATFETIYPLIESSPFVYNITNAPFNVLQKTIESIEMEKVNNLWNINITFNTNLITSGKDSKTNIEYNFISPNIISNYDYDSNVYSLNSTSYDTNITHPFNVEQIAKLHKTPYQKYSLKTLIGNKTQIVQDYILNNFNISMSYTYDVSNNHTYYKVNDLDNQNGIYNTSFKYGLNIEDMNNFTFVQTNSNFNDYVANNQQKINQSALWNKQQEQFTEKQNKLSLSRSITMGTLNTLSQFASGNIASGIRASVEAGFDVAQTKLSNQINLANAQNQIAMLNASITDVQNAPNQLVGNGDDMTGVLTKSNLNATIFKEDLWPALRNKIAWYFQIFGVNLGSIPRKINDYIDSHYHFNYLQTQSVFENYKEDMPFTNDVRQTLDLSFKQGITIWHYRDKNTWQGIKNWNVNNVETKYATIDKTQSFVYTNALTFGKFESLVDDIKVMKENQKGELLQWLQNQIEKLK